MNNLVKTFLCFFLLSCSQTIELGGNEHKVGKEAQNIFWIQLPGFSQEHLALLKFTDWNPSKGETYSRFSCLGSFWDYTLFEMRPRVSHSLNSQISGTSFDDLNCQSFSSDPFYQKVKYRDHSKIIVEEGFDSQDSLVKSLNCKSSSWLTNLVYLNRTNSMMSSERLSFHANNTKKLNAGLYDDKSCTQRKCFNSLQENFISLNQRFVNDEVVFVYRNLNYSRFLNSRNYKAAQEVLIEIENFINFIKKTYNSTDTLILLTGGGTINLDFPKRGKDWGDLSNSVKTEKRGIISPLLSYGASSELFCGIYQFQTINKNL